MDEQTKQGRSKINIDFKNNLHPYHKINMEIDYFFAGPETEANRVASVKSTRQCMMYIAIYLQVLGV